MPALPYQNNDQINFEVGPVNSNYYNDLISEQNNSIQTAFPKVVEIFVKEKIAVESIDEKTKLFGFQISKVPFVKSKIDCQNSGDKCFVTADLKSIIYEISDTEKQEIETTVFDIFTLLNYLRHNRIPIVDYMGYVIPYNLPFVL